MIYNHIVTWTAFAILAMFLLVTSVFFLYFSSFMCVLHLSIPVSGSLNSFSAFSHYFFLALFAVLPADTCCLLLTPNIVTRMTSTRQIAVVKEITRNSGPRYGGPTCITWNSCSTCITCTTEISHQLISWDIIDIARILVPQKYLSNQFREISLT